MSESLHKPVMLAEMLAAIAPRDGAAYVDGTFGAGGYSRAILEAADCTVCAIDRDHDAVALGRELERSYPNRLTILCGRFGDMALIASECMVSTASTASPSILASPRCRSTSRRAASPFAADGPLDMRMEQAGLSAADVVNGLEERALAEIIFDLGEERLARRVARAIVDARAIWPDRAHRTACRHRAAGSAARKGRHRSGDPHLPWRSACTSMTSSASSTPACRRRKSCSPRVAGSPSSRFIRSKTGG